MTTATTRKDDIGLVPFKDVCTLLHRIKTYHRKEGGKAKKHIARARKVDKAKFLTEFDQEMLLGKTFNTGADRART